MLPRPQPVDHTHVGDIHRGGDPARFPRPDRDQYGHSIGGRPSERPPERREWLDRTIDRRGIQDRLRQHERAEQERGRYYWHDEDGDRRCHYYDEHGFHWWGFYIGSDYFWTRYYMDRYWWYDPYYGRWVYRHENRWWWQDPMDYRAIYLYQGNNYYRYEHTNNGIVLQPDQTPPATPLPVPAPSDPTPAPAPAPADEKWYYSDDGTRSVQVAGEEKTAFLYDLTEQDADGNSKFLNYMSRNVVNVQFSDTAPDETGAAQPLQIVLTVLKPGGTEHVAVFDDRGVRLGATPAPAQPDPDGASTSPLGAGLQQSAAFSDLVSGVNW